MGLGGKDVGRLGGETQGRRSMVRSSARSVCTIPVQQSGTQQWKEYSRPVRAEELL
jgi:hypothetical protein